MKKQLSTKRISAIFLCLCFIVVSLLSMMYLIKEINHDCMGEHCKVCSNIDSAKNILKQLSNRKIEGENINTIILPLTITILFITYKVIIFTPVKLKVRMNN